MGPKGLKPMKKSQWDLKVGWDNCEIIIELLYAIPFASGMGQVRDGNTLGIYYVMCGYSPKILAANVARAACG